MDMPFAEIATVVGAPEPTVKSRMRYALERLRVALEEFREPGQGAKPPKSAESAGSG
jgi:RNA polymerase sigma-70 factor (ECF subfamily)